jgi:hypothetical protein
MRPNGPHNTSWRQATALTLGAGALIFTFGCNTTSRVPATSAQEPTAAQAGTPVVVSCEPHQRTLVRPAVVNGAAVSQVECIAAAPPAAGPLQAAYPAAPAPAAAAYAPAVAPVARPAQPVYSEVADARVVPVSGGAARPVRTSQIVYDERPVKRTRSVKKSAVIIGSSAGAGAGVGAMVGGKKGALIGAAVGGGGAAIWDQVTRRR